MTCRGRYVGGTPVVEVPIEVDPEVQQVYEPKSGLCADLLLTEDQTDHGTQSPLAIS